MLYNQNNLNVAKFASKSDIRPVFASVLVTPTKTVATDCTRLLEVSTVANQDASDFPDALTALPEGTDSVLVNAKTLLAIKLPKKMSIKVLESVAIKAIDKNTVDFVTNSLETKQAHSIRRVDDQFPDYKQVIPTGPPVTNIDINATLLAELLEVMGKLNKAGSVTIECHGANKPLVLKAVSSNGDQTALGLIMPLNNKK